MIATRHAFVAEDVLGEERQIESDEHQESGASSYHLGVHPASHFGPPEVQAAKISRYHRSHHYVMEMRDDEVGVVQMNIGRQRSEEQASEAADGEEADEAERVDHRRLETDITAVQRA